MRKRTLKNDLVKMAISEIDFEPGPFCMSYCFNLEPLKASIEKFGVINSPYLLRKSDSFFIVVGYQRLLAIKELGWKHIVCRLLPDDFSVFNALLFNLDDNIVNRHLNAIEKGMVLRRLTSFLSTKEIMANYMPMLGIPANKQQLELFLSLEELGDKVKISIATDRLSIRVAGLMRGLKDHDQLKINDLFTSFKWSFNQQWDAIQWIKEIASREGCSVKDIIDAKEIKSVIKNTKMNRPQKIKAIVKTLKIRRFPSLSKAEESFSTHVSRLSLPPDVRIVPPPFFEGTHYKLELAFEKGEELKAKLAFLSNLPGLREITNVWTGEKTDEPI